MRRDGMFINRNYTEGARVARLTLSATGWNDVGGFIAWSDLDDSPPEVIYLPVVGAAVVVETDVDGDRQSAILPVTFAGGEFEVWDLSGTHHEGLLGFTLDCTKRDVIDTHRREAQHRLTMLKARSVAAERALHGGGTDGPVR